MEMQKEYESLFETVPCGIIQLKMPVGDTCRVVKMNRRAVEILQLYPDQLESGTLFPSEYMDEKNRKTAATVLAQIKAAGDRGTFLLQLYQGTVQGEAELKESTDGLILQLIFMEIGNEIAMRRRGAEQAELLESVLQSVRCGVIRFGFVNDEQRIILANRTGWKLLGFESEKQCQELGLNGFLSRVQEDDRRVFLRTHCTLKDHNGKNSCEIRIYDQMGTKHWLSVEEQQLRDIHGNEIIQMTMMDVTAQKLQMEQKDAENGEIIQSLGTMYFIILYVDVRNDSYRVVKSSYPVPEDLDKSYSGVMRHQVARMSGEAGEERQIEEYMDILSIPEFQKRYQGKTLFWEHDFQSGSRDEMHYYRAETVLSGSGETLHHIVMGLRDVTGLRRRELQERQALQSAYEAATQASHAKSEFLSRMSHDIRTPMNAIVGLTQIMKKHLHDPKQLEEYLDKVEDSSGLLLELINDVLDMSRVESGKLVLEEQSMNLSTLAERIQIIIQPEMDKHGHTFQIDNQLPQQMVNGDGLRMQQMILNILSNCVKFTPDGGTIRWELWAEKTGVKKYQNTHMRISDNGIGMSREFMEKIYQPFEREERLDTQPIQGSGLGMAIVRNLVQLMNGWIEIQSSVGKGSSFHIMLPLRISEQETGTKPQKGTAEAAQKPDLKERRILLVEDNKINRIIAGELLRDTGAMIEEAVNGQEAVDQFACHEAGYYDLIFMDIRMPVLDGYEATRKIRALSNPDAARIPIIAMTANAFAEDVQEALAAGMNDHLAKPVQVNLLYQMLQQYLGKTKEREA